MVHLNTKQPLVKSHSIASPQFHFSKLTPSVTLFVYRLLGHIGLPFLTRHKHVIPVERPNVRGERPLLAKDNSLPMLMLKRRLRETD